MPYEPLLPPWSWNPAATFQTSYIAAQENQRAQEKFALQQELEQYLLPIKKQQALLEFEKMNLEVERTKGELERQRILTRQMTDTTRNVNRGINGALLEGPADAQTPDPRSAAYGLRSLFSPAAASTPATTTKKSSWRVVRPATPAATPTGP